MPAPAHVPETGAWSGDSCWRITSRGRRRTPLSSIRKKQIGLEVYTVRNLRGKDTEGTLAKVAEIGFKAIEPTSYGNLRADAGSRGAGPVWRERIECPGWRH